MKEAISQKQNLIYESELLEQVNKRDPTPTNLKFMTRTNKDELIMQYLEGFISLDNYLESNADRCKEIMSKVKSLVHQLHEKGISHRDLKGINVMIHPETEQLRIIDFGVGCINSSLKFPCQKYRGTTLNYYPKPQEMNNFKDWKKGDQNAMKIIQKKLCKK